MKGDNWKGICLKEAPCGRLECKLIGSSSRCFWEMLRGRNGFSTILLCFVWDHLKRFIFPWLYNIFCSAPCTLFISGNRWDIDLSGFTQYSVLVFSSQCFLEMLRRGGENGFFKGFCKGWMKGDMLERGSLRSPRKQIGSSSRFFGEMLRGWNRFLQNILF